MNRSGSSEAGLADSGHVLDHAYGPAVAHESDLPKKRTNLDKAPAVLADSIEEMNPVQAAVPADTVSRVAEGIPKVHSRHRPGRSQPRRSMKPVSKRYRRSGAST